MINKILIRCFDILFSLIFITITFPISIVLVLLVSIFIGFPPFYTHKRIGKIVNYIGILKLDLCLQETRKVEFFLS